MTDEKDSSGADAAAVDSTRSAEAVSPASHAVKGVHGVDCIKVPHWRHGAFLHPADHDGPYEIDHVQYCGRCHAWMGSQIVVIRESSPQSTGTLLEAAREATAEYLSSYDTDYVRDYVQQNPNSCLAKMARLAALVGSHGTQVLSEASRSAQSAAQK